MAKMSARARSRGANADYVVSSMDENREAVVQGLLPHNQGLPEAQRIDEATLRLFVGWLANCIRYKTVSMMEAETAYVDEQGDDPPVRERRDEAVPVLIQCVTQGRSRVGAVFGEVGLTTYAMREPVPRTPVELASYAGTSANLLRTYPRTAPDPAGGALNTVVLADAIDEKLAPLTASLSDLVTEQRQLQAAMSRRDAEVEEWNEVYVNGTAAFAWLARMAGQDAVAQRVRPTVRRSRGNDLAPELPGDGDVAAPLAAPAASEP